MAGLASRNLFLINDSALSLSLDPMHILRTDIHTAARTVSVSHTSANYTHEHYVCRQLLGDVNVSLFRSHPHL